MGGRFETPCEIVHSAWVEFSIGWKRSLDVQFWPSAGAGRIEDILGIC